VLGHRHLRDAALKVRVAAPLDILVTSLMLVTAAGVTLASYWHTHFRRKVPGPTFLYLQALFDVVLITAVVHMTGGADSDLASLYVILVAVTALLMPPANAGLVTVSRPVVLRDVFWGHSGGVSRAFGSSSRCSRSWPSSSPMWRAGSTCWAGVRWRSRQRSGRYARGR